MTRAAVTDLERYRELIGSDQAALDELVAELTVGETYFFREPEQLDFIRREVVPGLSELPAAAHPLRVWSAGCASGEEAYTLAILLDQGGVQHAHVVGTEISRERLGRARQARYTRWSLRGVPENVIRKYFTGSGKHLELRPEIREQVDFHYLNLAEDVYPSLSTGIWGMDLVLCRNVLIYLGRETIAAVAHRLMNSLSDRGWLFLGASDPPLAELVRCDVVVTGAGIAYRKARQRRSFAVSPPRPVAPLPRPGPPAEEGSDRPFPAEPRPSTPARGAVENDAAASAVHHYTAGDYAGAAGVAAREVERDGSDPGVWIILVRALANQGKLMEAGRVCASALDRHRTSAELFYLDAVLLAEAARFEDSAAAARRAIYLDRTMAVAHLALGGALVRLGQGEPGRRAFRNAERLLAGMPPEAPVPASDGEPAGRLREMAKLQLQLLMEAA